MEKAIKGDQILCGKVFLNNNQLNDGRYELFSLITDVIGLFLYLDLRILSYFIDDAAL